MSAKRSRWVAGVALAACWLALAPVAWAAEAPTIQEVVAAIKRRAQQILEERRKARRLRVSGEVSQLVGYDSNPANDPARKGDTYFEESLYLNWSKKLTPTIAWSGTYSGSYDKYLEYTDGDYTSHTVTPTKLVWQPGRMWRVEGAMDLGYTYYPHEMASNYKEVKPYLGVRQNLWGRWFHSIRYEYLLKQYFGKQARDGAGVNTSTHRLDQRHKLRYEVGTTWHDTLVKVRNEWYGVDSNDASNDFYDAQDYKVTASLNRQLTKRWSANASYAYELKQYRHRAVSGITAEARYDSTHTWTLAGTYDLNDTWSLGPNFTYKYLDSNDPTGEYVDYTITTTLTARF